MPVTLFRIFVIAFAGVLAICAVWLLLPEFVRPTAVAAFPFTPGAASIVSADSDRSRTAMAARLAILRGDLWADDAMLLASELGNGLYEAGGVASERFAAVRDAAQNAVRYAPHDARMWLILATAATRNDQPDARLPALLKMSYYTAPNDADLMRLRLLTAVRSEAITDADLQILVAGELRTIIQSRPDLKPAIGEAYRAAQAPGKKFILDALQSLDPALAASLQPGDSGK